MCKSREEEILESLKELREEANLPKDQKGNEAMSICKFFSPVGSHTWYVTEAEKQEDGDWVFFGLVINDFGKEFGYFTLKELESIRLPFGLRIERDIYFEPTKLNELK